MSKIRLSNTGKQFLMVIALFGIVAVGSILYMKQIDKINNHEIYVVCDCELDK